MQPPIFLVEPGHLAIYGSVREAETDLVAYGTRDPKRFICDATGTVLQENEINGFRITLSVPEGEPCRAEELANAIRDDLSHLRRIGQWQGRDDWLAAAPLDELVGEFRRVHDNWVAARRLERSARRRRILARSIVGVLTFVLTFVTTFQAVEQYFDLRTGWSWDLAYYNQWFWALTQGDRVISVRPLSPSARGAVGLEDELPGADPVRDGPDLQAASRSPTTLLVIQN